MKKLFLFGLGMIVACTSQKDKAPSNAQLDSFEVQMNNRLNGFYFKANIDSIDIYLRSLADTVKQLNYDRLSLHWLKGKAQLHYARQEFDSLKTVLNQAVQLSRGKGITQKDLLNFYSVYSAHLIVLGQMDSALQIANEANMLAKKIDTNRLAQTNLDLATIYKNMEDLPNQKKYTVEAQKHVAQEPELQRFIDQSLASYYDRIGNNDSAFYHFQRSLLDSNWTLQPVEYAERVENMGLFLIQKGRLKEGFKYLQSAKAIYDSLGMQNVITYLNLAGCYGDLRQYKQALIYSDSAISLAAQQNDPYLIRVSWQAAADLYTQVPDLKKAYAALDSAYVNYTIERDSSLRKYGREMESKYAVREKDMQIASLAITNGINQKVQHQQRIVIIAIIVAFLALSMAGIMFWRRRQLQYLLRESYLKQKVLQSQMEPHFVANILSVLKGFIRSGDQDRSISFLQLFARVTEQNLHNAQANLITVEAELNAIDQYLALQSIPMSNGFAYRINKGPDLEEDQIRIPPMLVQPFVENSLIHGISGLDYRGEIIISVDRRGPVLRCTVEDNGRGLMPHQKDPGGRIHAIAIAKERLELVRWQTGQRAYVEVTDKKQEGGQGVRVTLDIPWQYKAGPSLSSSHRKH